jgi:hypothetical protein
MEGGVVRCHLWREIADPGSALVPPRVEDPALARLRAAFAVRPGPGPGAV